MAAYLEYSHIDLPIYGYYFTMARNVNMKDFLCRNMKLCHCDYNTFQIITFEYNNSSHLISRKNGMKSNNSISRMQRPKKSAFCSA